MGHGGHPGHAGMIADFRRRFWICLVVTVPIVILSPAVQELAGLGDRLSFPATSTPSSSFPHLCIFTEARRFSVVSGVS